MLLTDLFFSNLRSFISSMELDRCVPLVASKFRDRILLIKLSVQGSIAVISLTKLLERMKHHVELLFIFSYLL